MTCVVAEESAVGTGDLVAFSVDEIRLTGAIPEVSDIHLAARW
jgi:hypothetical protein